MNSSAVAFVPARSGSKRIPHKNIQLFDGHPIMAYSIRSALQSGVFDAVICVTDSEKYAHIAQYYGAEVPFLRPSSTAGDQSPDIDWVMWMLHRLKQCGRDYQIFSILRPTNPFRQAETIQRAWSIFLEDARADSIRAVDKCKQHPGKMWVVRKKRMQPLLPFNQGTVPWHSSQYAALPEIYVQNASLEIAWTRVVFEQQSIAGDAIIPFMSQGYEGFDINTSEDWFVAERLLSLHSATLPAVNLAPYLCTE